MTTTGAQEPEPQTLGGGLAASAAASAPAAEQAAAPPQGWQAVLTPQRVAVAFGAFLLLTLAPFGLGWIDGAVLTVLYALASVAVLAAAGLQKRYGLAAFALFVLALSLLWRFDILSDNYMASLIVVASIYAILATSLNMSVGYTGLMSLSHAGFMGVGAYTFAILTTQTSNPPRGAEVFNLPYWPAIVAAGLVACVVALIVSPILRLRGHFFVLATVTVMLSLSQIILAFGWLTNGSLAIRDVPRPVLFGFAFDTAEKFLLFSIPVAILCILIIRQLVESPYGRVLTTIRANPAVASSIGKNVGFVRLRVYVTTAFFAGVAGAVYVSYFTVAAHSNYLVEFSTFLLIMVVLGGSGRWLGSVIGVIAYLAVSESVRFLPDVTEWMHSYASFLPVITVEKVGGVTTMLWGALLFFVMLFRPQGIIGRYRLE